MEQGHGEVRLFGFHGVEDGGDALGVHFFIGGVVIRVQKVHAVLVSCRHAHASNALGEGHKGHLEPLNLADGVALGALEFRWGGIGAHGLHSCGPDGLEGGIQPDKAIVDGAGVGHLNQVNARVAQGGEQLIGGGGGGGAVGLAADVALQVQQGQVRIGQGAGHILEGPGEVIARGGKTGIHYGIGDVQVACCPDVDGGGGLLGGPGFLGGSGLGGGGFRGEGGIQGSGGGSLGGVFHKIVDGSRAKSQHQHRRRQAETKLSLLGPLLFLLCLPPLPAFFHILVAHGHGDPSLLGVVNEI